MFPALHYKGTIEAAVCAKGMVDTPRLVGCMYALEKDNLRHSYQRFQEMNAAVQISEVRTRQYLREASDSRRAYNEKYNVDQNVSVSTRLESDELMNSVIKKCNPTTYSS